MSAPKAAGESGAPLEGERLRETGWREGCPDCYWLRRPCVAHEALAEVERLKAANERATGENRRLRTEKHQAIERARVAEAEVARLRREGCYPLPSTEYPYVTRLNSTTARPSPAQGERP